MIYIKMISLFICLWFTPVIIFNAYQGNRVAWHQLLTMAIGWTAFIFSMGWLSS